jgi:hypothetical protein
MRGANSSSAFLILHTPTHRFKLSTSLTWDTSFEEILIIATSSLDYPTIDEVKRTKLNESCTMLAICT